MKRKTDDNMAYGSKTINAFLDQKYGKIGTKSRKEFEQKAEA